MRSISARELQRNLPKYLKELPVTINIWNKPVAIISPYKTDLLTNQPQPVDKLIKITESDLQEIADNYKVTLAFVKYHLEALRNYCASSGKQYRDYKAALRNFVIRDLKSQIEKKTSIKGKVVDGSNI